MLLRRILSSEDLPSASTEQSRWSWRRLDSFRALAMDLSLDKLSMVVEEEMDMEEAEVVDITVEVTMDTEEVPMVGVEVTHPWAEGPEAAVAATIPPSGLTIIAVWV
jgi:hypothetical protein